MRASHQSPDDFIFPGGRPGQQLSESGMLALIKRMGRGDLTVHGFRSSFRDWAAECTTFSRDVAEMALAHAITDDVEAAYRRGDLLEKRRRMMEAWAEFCDTQPGLCPGVLVMTRTMSCFLLPIVVGGAMVLSPVAMAQAPDAHSRQMIRGARCWPRAFMMRTIGRRAFASPGEMLTSTS
jgi:hypothetical protein